MKLNETRTTCTFHLSQLNLTQQYNTSLSLFPMSEHTCLFRRVVFSTFCTFESKLLQGWIGRRNGKNFTFFSPAGECLKTRKQMFESKEFLEASKDDQLLLTDFKPQRSISLDRAHSERRRMLDDNSVKPNEQSQYLENPEEKEQDKEEAMEDSDDIELEDFERVAEDIKRLEDPKEETVEVSKTDLASDLASKILAGWKRSGNRGMISPEGTQFRTKRQAIVHLVKVGGSEGLVEALRELCVVEEGWTREKLPKGWLGKERDKVL